MSTAVAIVSTLSTHTNKYSHVLLRTERPGRIARTTSTHRSIIRIRLIHLGIQACLQIRIRIIALHGGPIIGQTRARTHSLHLLQLKLIPFCILAFIEEFQVGVLERDGERVRGGRDLVGTFGAGYGPVEGCGGFGLVGVVVSVGVACPGQGLGGAVCLDGVEEGY